VLALALELAHAWLRGAVLAKEPCSSAPAGRAASIAVCREGGGQWLKCQGLGGAGRRQGRAGAGGAARRGGAEASWVKGRSSSAPL